MYVENIAEILRLLQLVRKKKSSDDNSRKKWRERTQHFALIDYPMHFSTSILL